MLLRLLHLDDMKSAHVFGRTPDLCIVSRIIINLGDYVSYYAWSTGCPGLSRGGLKNQRPGIYTPRYAYLGRYTIASISQPTTYSSPHGVVTVWGATGRDIGARGLSIRHPRPIQVVVFTFTDYAVPNNSAQCQYSPAVVDVGFLMDILNHRRRPHSLGLTCQVAMVQGTDTHFK
jgi:hypothetical protein